MHRIGFLSLLILTSRLLAACAPATPPEPANVLVVVIDTLRADRLGCYGAARETSPAIDALAADGVLFEEAIASAPRTWQSFATILTGLYPLHHDVRFIFDQPLSDEIETLGSLLGAAGYDTAAFDSLTFLRGITAGRGFHAFIDSQGSGAQLPDEKVAEGLIRWLSRERQGPFFAFVRFTGPHWPYRPDRRFHELFGSDEGIDHGFNAGAYGIRPGAAGEGWRLTDPEAYRRKIFRVERRPEVLDHMLLHYDACVRSIDEIFGRVIQHLRDAGLFASTLVVVTSDHGENFGEQGYMQHGPRVNRSVLRVPLVLRFPEDWQRRHAGTRIPQLVRTADLAPTLLDALGRAIPPGLDGVSLLPALRGGTDLALTAYAESGREFVGVDPERALPGVPGKQRMLRSLRWKVVYRHDGEQPLYRLYDLETDPAEGTDVAARHPRVLAELRSALDGLMSSDVSPGKHTRAVTEEQARQLRALGYLQ
jgi:arylsulfatase A-like enzyme